MLGAKPKLSKAELRSAMLVVSSALCCCLICARGILVQVVCLLLQFSFGWWVSCGQRSQDRRSRIQVSGFVTASECRLK